MTIHRPLRASLAALVVVAGMLTGPSTSVSAAVALPAVPATWPSSKLELGLADAPGGAAALRASAAFGFRYQYLAGGVNTGNGWATWNTNGTFVSMYIADSVAHGLTPVFPYYMLLQSNPSTGADEKARDLSNLANTATMAAYYADLRLFFTRAAGPTPVVLHVEPDLWGYIEQNATADNAATVPASVASSGDAALAGLPNNAAGFAQAIVRLRNALASNVILAYHLSVWGTNFDISISNDSDAHVDQLSARAAAFYASLGASFDIAFTDIGDRDAEFKRAHYPGDNGQSWWDAADFVRYARFIGGFVAATGKRMVVWQIPLGNTKMRALDNTWGHYQDNRVEWFLDDPGGTHLALWRDAGVVALLYGGGAGGTTCSCDAIGDGTTNPPAINGNTRMSITADDDGGYFKERAGLYYTSGGLTIGTGADPPPVVTTWSTGGTATPTTVSRGHSVSLAVRIRPSTTIRARVLVQVTDSSGRQVYHHQYGFFTFHSGITTTYHPSFRIGTTSRTGTYSVKIQITSTTGASLLANRTVLTFKVRA